VDQVLEPYLEASRAELVEGLTRVVSDPRVLSAFETVPRHLFVDAAQRGAAYDDRALRLMDGQTISQPSMIAVMLDALAAEPSQRALEVGAGSGYAAALLSTLVREVHAVEIRPALSSLGRVALERAKIDNVVIHEADGSEGLPSEAPFDRILVSAAARAVPLALVEQLAPLGRIVIPVGGEEGQTLRVGSRMRDGGIHWEEGTACIFVPLVSARAASGSDPGRRYAEPTVRVVNAIGVVPTRS
jgi:protein-L-isoaspartate(D-aspartate) O-methyltransferase